LQRQRALSRLSVTSKERIVRFSYGVALPKRDFTLLAETCLEGRLKPAPYTTRRIGQQDIHAGMDCLRIVLDLSAVTLAQMSA
jgi:hypothetical protein